MQQVVHVGRWTGARLQKFKMDDDLVSLSCDWLTDFVLYHYATAALCLAARSKCSSLCVQRLEHLRWMDSCNSRSMFTRLRTEVANGG